MPDTRNQTSSELPRTAAVNRHVEHLPRAALLHSAAWLSGLGTAFLGPSLPSLAVALHLSDRGGGSLLAAQFVGAFLGGWTTRSPLRQGLLTGYVAATIGFALFALDLKRGAGTSLAIAALLLLGFGVGRVITSNNLLASRRWPEHRGAALLLLNFTWSVGALCAPLLLPSLLATFGSARVFGIFTALLFIALLATALAPGRSVPAEALAAATAPRELTQRTFLYFCLQLFVYGGVETSLSGWLTTYDVRYTAAAHSFAASTAAFWFCLTGTRAVASALLLRIPERPVLRVGLLLSVVTLGLLLAIGHGRLLPLLAGLTGAALAPWFPLLFSGLVSEGPTPAQAGRIVAVSGLGAAAMPWLVGQLSANTGSLRIALLLPIAGAITLFLLSFRRPPVAAEA